VLHNTVRQIKLRIIRWEDCGRTEKCIQNFFAGKTGGKELLEGEGEIR
jgi:hypothetical protein